MLNYEVSFILSTADKCFPYQPNISPNWRMCSYKDQYSCLAVENNSQVVLIYIRIHRGWGKKKKSLLQIRTGNTETRCATKTNDSSFLWRFLLRFIMVVREWSKRADEWGVLLSWFHFDTIGQRLIANRPRFCHHRFYLPLEQILKYYKIYECKVKSFL